MIKIGVRTTTGREREEQGISPLSLLTSHLFFLSTRPCSRAPGPRQRRTTFFSSSPVVRKPSNPGMITYARIPAPRNTSVICTSVSIVITLGQCRHGVRPRLDLCEDCVVSNFFRNETGEAIRLRVPSRTGP